MRDWNWGCIGLIVGALLVWAFVAWVLISSL